MSKPCLEQARAFTEPATKPVSGKAPTQARHFRIECAVKIGLAGNHMVGAASALVVGQSLVTAENAVVTACVLSVRSPIQGKNCDVGFCTNRL
jgi:hypothetical protein